VSVELAATKAEVRAVYEQLLSVACGELKATASRTELATAIKRLFSEVTLHLRDGQRLSGCRPPSCGQVRRNWTIHLVYDQPIEPASCWCASLLA
jgi:hypothetical protein